MRSRFWKCLVAFVGFATFVSCSGGSRSFPIPPKRIEVVNGTSVCFDRSGSRGMASPGLPAGCGPRVSLRQAPAVNALSVADAVLEAQVRQITDQVALRELLEAAALINLSKRPVVPRVVIGTAIQATSHGAWTATGGGAPCDGDLPPCWRIIGTESGGRWDAYNPGGCVENGIVWGCWGPYQFSGSWHGKLGLPWDLRTTTKEQWVNAARTLWSGGRGCSNWSAC